MNDSRDLRSTGVVGCKYNYRNQYQALIERKYWAGSVTEGSLYVPCHLSFVVQHAEPILCPQVHLVNVVDVTPTKEEWDWFRNPSATISSESGIRWGYHKYERNERRC